MARTTPQTSPAPVAYRIWFAPEPAGSAPPDPARVLRRFRDPSPTLALVETRPIDAVLASAGPPAAAELHVISLPTGVSESQLAAAQRWLQADADAPPIIAESEELGLAFRPGRAIIEADPEQLDAALAGLVDFAFYEQQLQKLEDEVAARWREVETDLPFISKIDAGAKKVWPGLYDKLEHQHRLGMVATRIEHRVALLTRGQPPELRPLLARLRARARMKTRFEQLNSHLEVRDGVYDQIGYRLADHRQLRASLVIEAVIVLLLVMEVGISVFNLAHGAH